MPRRPKRVIGRPFRKGHDPRRHKFTPEECAKGYEQATLSVAERFPEALCQHGANLSHCLLRVKSPLYFEARKLAKQLSKVKRRNGHDKAKIERIERQINELKAMSFQQRGRAKK